MTDDKIHDKPSKVTAEDGVVIVEGPDAVDVRMTPERQTKPPGGCSSARCRRWATRSRWRTRTTGKARTRKRTIEVRISKSRSNARLSLSPVSLRKRGVVTFVTF